MGFSSLAKYKIPIIFCLFLLFLYLASRLLTISQLPLFTDEAIYVRWAQIAKNDANWRFISLTDGKQPLFIWFVIVAMKFINDPLVAARVVSVFAGIGTSIGLFFVTRQLFRNYWIGIISASLYVIYSFALVYDRMALYDGLVGTFFIWGLYMAILLVRTRRLDVALIAGMVNGAATLNKTPGFFNIYLLPVSILLLNLRTKNERMRTLVKWAGLAMLVAVMTYGIYSLLRLSPFFHIITQKNALFVYPFSQWIQHPFQSFFGNLFAGLQDWFFRYMTISFAVLIIWAFFIDKKFLKEKLLLFLWFFIPFIALAFFGNRLYPRYIFFMTLPLLPLIAYTLIALKERIQNKILFSIVVTLGLFLQLHSSFLVLFNFPYATIPYSDVSQYNNDWPSGTGIKESVAFFEQQAQDQTIFVATQGTFGLMPYAYEIYLGEHPNVEIKGYWPIGKNVPSEVVATSEKMPTYFVFYQGCAPCPAAGLAPLSWGNATPVLQIPKFAPNVYLSVYQISPGK